MEREGKGEGGEEREGEGEDKRERERGCQEEEMVGGSGVNTLHVVLSSRLFTRLRKSMTSFTERVATWVRGSTVDESSAAITRPANDIASVCSYRLCSMSQRTVSYHDTALTRLSQGLQ